MSGSPAGQAGHWDLLSGSVRGKGKKYSQDHCHAGSAAGGAAALVAVADGHGSASYHRSHLGSRWAVEALVSCAAPFARQAIETEDSPAAWSGLFADARRIPRLVFHQWRRRALLYEANNPSAPPAVDGAVALTPYGSTLIGAVITRRLVFCWQLGDGDLVLMGSDATAWCPLAEAEEVRIGDETDSLCQPEAWRLMRFYAQPLHGLGRAPLVMLSTDGLSNSYAERRGFLKSAADLHADIVRQGSAATHERLPDWLAQAAAHSGDDTTLTAVLTTD